MWIDDCLLLKHYHGGSGDGDGRPTMLFHLSRKMRGLFQDGPKNFIQNSLDFFQSFFM